MLPRRFFVLDFYLAASPRFAHLGTLPDWPPEQPIDGLLGSQPTALQEVAAALPALREAYPGGVVTSVSTNQGSSGGRDGTERRVWHTWGRALATGRAGLGLAPWTLN